MYPVTPEYLDAMNKNTRDSSYFRIGFEILNENIENNANIQSTSNILEWSDVDNIINKKVDSIQFITFEKDYIKIDHSQYIYNFESPITITNNAGFESNQISNENYFFENQYKEYPFIKINLGTIDDILALTLYFDIFNTNNYINTFELKAYYENYQNLQTRLIENNTDIKVVLDDLGFTNVNTLEIIFIKGNRANIRPRLWQIKFGIDLIYSNEELQKVSIYNEFDPTSLKLPNQHLSFTIDNRNQKYNPENPFGIYEYLSTKQLIKAEFGVQTINNIEWIPIGNYYLNSWTADRSIATFEGVSLIDLLIESFTLESYWKNLDFVQDPFANRGNFNINGYYLYDALVELLNSIDENYVFNLNKITNQIKSLKTYKPPYPMEKRIFLQLICQAMGLCIYHERFLTKKEISILPLKQQEEIFKLNFENAEVPEIKKTPEISEIKVKIYTYIRESEIRKLWEWAENGTDITDFKTFEVNLGLVSPLLFLATYNINDTPTINLISDSINKRIKYTVNGKASNFNFIIAGNNINIIELYYTRKLSDTGEPLIIDNEFCTDENVAKTIADNYEYWYKQRLNYSVSYRGEPALDGKDGIGLQTIFSENKLCTLLSNSYDWQQGSIKNSNSTLKVGDN